MTTNSFPAIKDRKVLLKGNCEFFFAATLFLPYFSSAFINTVRYFISNTYKLDTLLVYGLYMVLGLSCLNEILCRLKRWQFILALSILAVLFGSTLFSSNQAVNNEVIKDVVFSCLPAFFLAGTVRDFSKLKHLLYKYSLYIPYLQAFTFYVLRNNILENGTYSQSMSYFMLLPTTVLIDSLIEKFRIQKLVPLLISLFIMLSFGARGPLVCIVLFFLCKIIFFYSFNVRKKLLIILSILLFGSILYINHYSLLQFLLNLFERLGLSTRTVQYLLNRSFFEDSARFRIFGICLERILDNPLWGTGMVNDRIYIADALQLGANPIGYYPHNFFLEILLQFGLVIGIVLLIFFFRFLIKCLGHTVPQDTKSVVLILFGNGFLPLMFSGSYVNLTAFYLLAGVCGTVLYFVRHPIETKK